MNRNRNMKAAKGGNLRQNPRKRQGTARRSAATSSTHPPELTYQETRSKTLRFVCTAAVVQQQITFANLLDTILIATTAIQPYDLYDLVRIRRIRVWGILAIGTSTTAEITFNSATGDRAVHTDTSLGVRPAYVSAKPSPNSLASFWQVAAAGNAFLLTCPAGSIIDVELSFRDSPGVGQGAANPSVGATIGSVFYRGLDGLAAAGTNFPVPVGIPSF